MVGDRTERPPDEVGEHVVECHHRDRQDEGDPEQPPELADMITVPAMAVLVGRANWWPGRPPVKSARLSGVAVTADRQRDE